MCIITPKTDINHNSLTTLYQNWCQDTVPVLWPAGSCSKLKLYASGVWGFLIPKPANVYPVEVSLSMKMNVCQLQACFSPYLRD